MQTFSMRDLREHSGELVRQAEAGHLSLIVKRGQPLFMALPFDESSLRQGVGVALACKLFAEHAVSLGKAAHLAGLPIEEFIEKLAAVGVPAVDYPAEELDAELAALAS